MNPRDPLSDPKFEAQATKPPAINRMDPAWVMFAAAMLPVLVEPLGNADKRALLAEFGTDNSATIATIGAADFADAMLRERDRRDREERP